MKPNNKPTMDARKKKICCKEFSKQMLGRPSFVGGGGLYPTEARPDAQGEVGEDGTWNVNGCCGGGCYVLTGLQYCPFCGEKL